MKVHHKKWNQISLFPFTKVRSGGTKQQKVLLEVQLQLLPVCREAQSQGWVLADPEAASPASLAAAALLATAEPGETGRKIKVSPGSQTQNHKHSLHAGFEGNFKGNRAFGTAVFQRYEPVPHRALNRAQTHPTASDSNNSFRAVASPLHAWGKTSSLINFL